MVVVVVSGGGGSGGGDGVHILLTLAAHCPVLRGNPSVAANG